MQLQHHARAASAPARARPRRVAVAAAAAAQQHVPVAIAGAGIAGLAAAVALHQLGVPAVVLERAPGLRQEGSAVSLWSNAWRALDALGVAQELRGHYALLDKVELVSSGGRLLRRFGFDECATGAPSDEMRGVRRLQLLEALATRLPQGALRYSSGVEAVAGPSEQPLLELSSGERLSCDVLVGADGANSVVAKHLGMQPLRYAGYVAFRGVARFASGQLPLPRDTVRQVFGRGTRAGMYPLSEREAYWYCCFNAPPDSPRPADAAGCAAEALAAVEGWAWGISEAIRCTPPDTISRSAIRDRWTAGSFGRGCITLAGDAAHPMTPNLGQGGCCALEDAVVLARQLAPLLRGAGAAGGAGPDPAALAAGCRAYEAARSARCLPLTLRSWAFGVALQLPYAPVCAARDEFVARAFRPDHFLDHTTFDCGTLQAAA